MGLRVKLQSYPLKKTSFSTSNSTKNNLTNQLIKWYYTPYNGVFYCGNKISNTL